MNEKLVGIVLTAIVVVAQAFGWHIAGSMSARKELRLSHNCAHYEVDARTGEKTYVVTCETCKGEK